MTSPVAGWRLSVHARERLHDRAVLPSELVRLLEAPEWMQAADPNKPHQQNWWRGGVCAVVDPHDREVITIHAGGGRSTPGWEQAARERRSSGPVDDAEALLRKYRANVPARRAPGRQKAAQPPVAPVVVRKIKRFTVSDLSTPLKLYVRQARDAKLVRVLSPGCVEIIS